MLRFSLIAVALSAYLCALRAGPALQTFVFESDDPLSLTALLSLLGASIILFTGEISGVFLLESPSLGGGYPALHRHPWLPSLLALAGTAAITILVHLLLPARGSPKPPERINR